MAHFFKATETLANVDDVAYHWAIYRLCRDYHSGQSSKGYRLLCIADQRFQRDHSRYGYSSLGKIDEMYCGRFTITRKSFTRKRMAFYLRKLMKFRNSL